MAAIFDRSVSFVDWRPDSEATSSKLLVHFWALSQATWKAIDLGLGWRSLHTSELQRSICYLGCLEAGTDADMDSNFERLCSVDLLLRLSDWWLEVPGPHLYLHQWASKSSDYWQTEARSLNFALAMKSDSGTVAAIAFTSIFARWLHGCHSSAVNFDTVHWLGIKGQFAATHQLSNALNCC